MSQLPVVSDAELALQLCLGQGLFVSRSVRIGVVMCLDVDPHHGPSWEFWVLGQGCLDEGTRVEKMPFGAEAQKLRGFWGM